MKNKIVKHCIVIFIITVQCFLYNASAMNCIWQDQDNKLSIRSLGAMNEKVFKNLQLCYECEFASITQTPMTCDAEYDQNELASHWSKNRDLLVFYVNAIPAGFSVVNYGSMIQEKPEVHDIGEFYITPIFRKKGYGKTFARAVFLYYSGSWEVRQLLELETTARNFWHSVIASLKHGNFQEFIDHPGWRGYVQCFTCIAQ